MIKKKVQISKLLSFILRHHPERYNLELDDNGFTHFRRVFEIVQKQFPFLEKEDLVQIIEDDPQVRFQIEGVMIRARYGHSVDVMPIDDVTKEVPKKLFHGTSRKNAENILKEGLSPKKRRFVHLSLNIVEAMRVGKRKDAKPVVLEIDTEAAQSSGINFWMEGIVCLCEAIPPQFIKIHLKQED